jgi:hypothetical protein
MDILSRLHITRTEGAAVAESGPGRWRLEIPAGPQGKYRLAQLDDTGKLRRKDYLWQPPARLSLRARCSGQNIPGTWGFGWWNNPFGMGIIRGVELLRLPALPNAAWFFFASPENYLSLRDDLPASGALAATFCSPRIPTALLALGAPGLPLALLKPGMRLARRLGQGVVRQSAAQVKIDPTQWHTYEVDWKEEQVTLRVDGEAALETRLAPLGPLGLVIWVDNQYAALRPDGSIGFGTLENPKPAWIEFEDFNLP